MSKPSDRKVKYLYDDDDDSWSYNDEIKWLDDEDEE